MSLSTIKSGESRQYTTFDPETKNKTVFINPGESRELLSCEGSGVLQRIWLTFPGWFWRAWDETAAVDPTVLRLSILRIYFDGCPLPSVEAPIGDFFGVGHCEYRHFTSKFLGMSRGGFYCYLPMPFSGGFRLEIENLHTELPLELFYNINCEMRDETPPEEGRLHCAFRCEENPGALPTEILNVQGQGHFAGCAVSIQGSRPNCLSFLEAPEKIYIDCEKTAAPTLYGTGLEDYFGGGWYFRGGEFCSETHGVPLKDALRSMISMYRFHEHDPIRFSHSMQMEFKNPWSAERLPPFISSSTAYYYLKEAGECCYRVPSAKELTRLYRVRDMDFQSIP